MKQPWNVPGVPLEYYKPINGFEGLYSISNYGRV